MNYWATISWSPATMSSTTRACPAPGAGRHVRRGLLRLQLHRPADRGTVFDAYKLITYGETTVAYVGICTPETFTQVHPRPYFQDEDGNFIYGFCEGNNGQDLYDAVQKAIDDAKAEGADYVIAVGHLGDSEESAPWRSEDVIANVSGLSAFIDGHSHSTVSGKAVTDKDGNTVLLNQTGTELAAIGKIILSADGSVTAELITRLYRERS